jgi:hypothetical protein
MTPRTLAFVALSLISGTASAAPPEVKLFDDAASALRTIVAAHPRVIGFGEYHQKIGAVPLASSLKRFTDELLPVVAPDSADIVVETWVNEGNCGESEKEVVKDVAKTTERPVTTESEVVTMIKKAKAGGIQPHILTMTCAEYQSLQGKDGVDYARMLELIASHLQEGIEKALPHAGDGKMVLSYGGALHNDLFPLEELKGYAFGQALQKETKGRYLEVDLYVPEWIEKDELITKEAWYPHYKKQAKAGKVALVKKGAGSYAIVFARAK